MLFKLLGHCLVIFLQTKTHQGDSLTVLLNEIKLHMLLLLSIGHTVLDTLADKIIKDKFKGKLADQPSKKETY